MIIKKIVLFGLLFLLLSGCSIKISIGTDSSHSIADTSNKTYNKTKIINTLAYDDELFSIDILNIKENVIYFGDIYTTIDIKIKNKSDINIYFQLEGLRVNGFSFRQNYVYSDIFAKTSSTITAYISQSIMKTYGIEKISRIDLGFFVGNVDNEEILAISSEYGVSTNYSSSIQEYIDNGTESYENDGIYLSICGNKGNNTIEFFVRNDRDVYVSIDVDSLSINGQMINDSCIFSDGSSSLYIMPHSCLRGEIMEIVKITEDFEYIYSNISELNPSFAKIKFNIRPRNEKLGFTTADWFETDCLNISWQ